MHPGTAFPLACFLSVIRPPGVEFEDAYLSLLPVDKRKCPFVRDINDVGFRLYTRHNPTTYQELIIDDDQSLEATHINFNDPTVVFFHAWLENTESGSALQVRQAYMIRGDHNVIMVEAQRLASGPWYFTAADNTWYIGQMTARLVDYLVSRGLDLSKTHFVGHSLGAQAAGVAGSALRSGRVSRITGLDPAMPAFEKLPLIQKLDLSDAHYVDVIHTDAGIFGVNHPMGHADYFPNGGISPQPGCELEIVWPRQEVLNKCSTHTFAQPLHGYFTFELTPNIDKLKSKAETKIKKYFRYDKEFRQYKKTFDKSLKYYTELAKMENQPKEVVNKEEYPEAVNTNEYSKKEPKLHLIIDGYTTINKPNQPKEVVNKEKYTEVNIKDENKKEPKIHVIIDGYTIANKATEIRNRLKNKEATTVTHTDVEETTKTHTKKDLSQTEDLQISYQSKTPIAIKKRTKRFTLFRRPSEASEQDNFVIKMLEFIMKNRNKIVPVVSVMREINTLVKTSNGELNQVTKERNNYIGTPPPAAAPLNFNLELGKDPPVKAFFKRMLGLGTHTEKLHIHGK